MTFQRTIFQLYDANLCCTTFHGVMFEKEGTPITSLISSIFLVLVNSTKRGVRADPWVNTIFWYPVPFSGDA
jgi:hypothetical protein